MSLRFTDTNKWDDDWFLGLSPLHKLIHAYLYDKCDVAGIWRVGMTDLTFRTGATADDWRDYLTAAKDRLLILAGGKTVWLINFIPDQNPRGLTPRNPTVSGIVRSLVKNEAPIERLDSPYQAPLKSFITNNEQGAIKGLISPQGIGQGKGLSVVEESEEENRNGNQNKNDWQEADKWARFAFTAFPVGCPLSIPSNLLHNCADLIRNGRLFSELEEIVAWMISGSRKFKPKSPAAMTDPQRFDGWLSEARQNKVSDLDGVAM